MSKPEVFFIRKLPKKALKMIQEECYMKIMKVNLHDRALTRGELREVIQVKKNLKC